MTKIYTDGSCLGNPGAGGWAAVIVDEQNNREELFGGEEHTTNNRMELTAAIRALEKIPADVSVELFTDSNYLKNAFTNGWLAKWKRNGWRTATGGQVLNRDLWLALDELISNRVVEFNWVKGHAGNFFNERCDELAHRVAEKIRRQENIIAPPKISPPKVPKPAENFSKPVQLSLF
mgnify:CR=1 FL=1